MGLLTLPTDNGNNERVEVVGDGIKLKLIQDGQIAIYSFEDPTPDSIDVWAAHTLALDYNESHTRYATLLDLSSMENALSPYMRRRVVSVFRALPPGTFYLAVLTARSLFSRQTFQKMLRREVDDAREDLHMQFFTDQRNALTWLETAIKSA